MRKSVTKPLNTLDELLTASGVKYEDFTVFPSRNLIKIFPQRTRSTCALIQQIWKELSLDEDIQSSFVRDMPLTEFKKFLLTTEYKEAKSPSLALTVIKRASTQISAVSTKLKIVDYSSQALAEKGTANAYYALMAVRVLHSQGICAPVSLESCVKGTKYYFDFLNV
jgi:hypothetical protein